LLRPAADAHAESFIPFSRAATVRESSIALREAGDRDINYIIQ
jgi:hypothetical protein